MQQSGQKGGKLRLCDAPTEVLRRRCDPVQRLRDVYTQLDHVVGSPVRQGALRQGPHRLIGVELRRVRREVLGIKAGLAALQFAQWRTLVGVGVVEQHDHRPAQMPQQVAEELADLDLSDVPQRMQPVVQVESLSLRADRHTRDDRHLVPLVTVANHWRLPTRCPRAQHSGDQEEPALVDEDEIGAQPLGFFLIRGHSSRFQRSMAPSLRSTARRSGFWWLQPRPCRRRPTCARW